MSVPSCAENGGGRRRTKILCFEYSDKFYHLVQSLQEKERNRDTSLLINGAECGLRMTEDTHRQNEQMISKTPQNRKTYFEN